MHYYNEIDKLAANTLRELIRTGHLPHGEVDDRSIADVTASDLYGFTSCHFFAGIGGWPLALRLAGWREDIPAWTGSCPCQPFSLANATATGVSDSRHLWPEQYRLIRECRPSVWFGEQVASPDALAWLDGIQDDLADAGYASGAVALCAAGVGAPHVRERLFIAAHPCGEGRSGLMHERGAIPRVSQPQIAFPDNANAGRWPSVDPSSPDIWLRDGLSHAMARRAIKCFGNAVVPQVAAEFVNAYMGSVLS